MDTHINAHLVFKKFSLRGGIWTHYIYPPYERENMRENWTGADIGFRIIIVRGRIV